ncbi:MAG: class I SAM-dependent methyltransferase, partial [Anaerolineae bacterium]|nr:class I SAM-dependent methyltransferase [Anaerolineae bacterium]
MRKRQTSISALGIATVRALEMERPEGERLYTDPYARQFIPGWLYALIKLFDRMGYAERKGPGVMGFLRARDRYIDDVLEMHLSEGLDQL